MLLLPEEQTNIGKVVRSDKISKPRKILNWCMDQLSKEDWQFSKLMQQKTFLLPSVQLSPKSDQLY